MDQPYMLDQVDPKQTPGPQMRRGYFGDDHDIYRQTNSLDLKYPFPQTHLYPPSSSVRGGPIKNPGQFPQDNQGGQEGHGHVNDPRYVPQEFASSVRDMDEKRFKGHYGYPSAQAPGQNIMNNGLNPASGINMYNTSGAGATPFNGMMIPPPVASGQPKAKENNGLVPPIPPLHVQHEISRKEQPELNPNSPDAIHSKCSRCKKDFVQRLVSPQETGKGKSTEPKIFKLCFHCRDLQRQRSRRWQKKTKDKEGACRRCGSEIPVDQQRFVLCPQCRKSLRIRKANRAAQGRCVHCSGPITSSIKDDSPDGESSEDPESRRSSVAGSFKVCQRCRENDKIRRTNLERMGNCNRCAKALTPEDQGKHKVCFTCRQKKKKGNSAGFWY
ncbi:hypothetical protein JCM33374_g618 [Metschnikowia sp. JCM 33374]|nr:hypothetical protein JCM33374_g618 [Metschnikowia sp. JCM 33374]